VSAKKVIARLAPPVVMAAGSYHFKFPVGLLRQSVVARPRRRDRHAPSNAGRRPPRMDRASGKNVRPSAMNSSKNMSTMSSTPVQLSRV
jgi:hypothetical protein